MTSDFITLAKAMELKRKAPVNIKDPKNTLDKIEGIYDEMLLNGFGPGSDKLLETILNQDQLLEIEDISVPMTTIDMLERGE